MSSYGNTSRRIRPDSLRVDASACPGWLSGAECSLAAGERVYCAEGMAEIVRILGKTTDGSRLLELQIDDGRRAAFFAAASNVLVDPGMS